MKSGRYIIKLVVLLFLASQVLMAQTITGTILGTVQDSTGAVIPGATVTLRNVETGIARTLTTDDAGRYRAPQLGLGSYEVTAEVGGFQSTVRTGITLTVGRQAVVDFALQVGAVTEQITVTGEAPLVETAGAAISALVGESEMADLPLNGRSFDALLTLDSGAATYVHQSGSSIQGFGTKFTVSGQRWESNKFYQDGIELLGASRIGDTPASASGLMLGVDSIREFQMLTSSYSAEYGKKAGAAVITVTKSGTNALHGTAFEFLRNNNLDARKFFDVGGPPQFKRNNFGGTLGGPIKRDKMFFFANYEGVRERRGITQIAVVPDLNARQGLLPDPETGEPTPVDDFSPTIQPFFVLFPEPDGRNFGDGTAESFNAAPSSRNADYGTVRFDYNISDSDLLFLSYTIDDASLTDPLRNRFFTRTATTRNHRVALEQTHIFSPNLLNAFRVGFNRSGYSLDTVELIDIGPALTFHPGFNFGTFTFGALTGPGGFLSRVGDHQGPNWNFNNLYQISNKVSYTVGSHQLDLGGVIQRIHRNEFSTDLFRGVFDFRSMEDLLAARPFRITAMGIPPEISGTTNAGVEIADSNYVKGWRQTYSGLFVQDSWKATTNLTVDLGMRFEIMTTPKEVNGRTTQWTINRTTPGGIFVDDLPVVGKPILNSATAAAAPRFGLAWDPFGDGKTVIRAGFGVFYEQYDNQYRFAQDTNLPHGARISWTRPPLEAFPQPFVAVPFNELLFGGRMVDPNLDPGTVYQYNFGVQRELGQGMVGKLSYIGSRGYHLTNSIAINNVPADILPDGRKFKPAGRARANPLWDRISMHISAANSWYNSFKAEVEKRFGSGRGTLSDMRFKWAYTFARSIDLGSALQGSAQGNGSRIQDPQNLPEGKGLSAFDIRHNLAFNFSYLLPKPFTGGVGTRLFNDWTINGFLAANTGMPNGIVTGFGSNTRGSRPDLCPGGNNNPVLGGPDQYFDPLQFCLQPDGFFGNLGRNTMIGPGLVNFDFSLEKGISLSERLNLKFRAEFFNLLNRANFGVSNRRIFTRSARQGSAGRISNVVTSAREIQFGLRLEF